MQIGQAEVKVIEGDITNQEVGAIVNAANKQLSAGGGVSGAIHRAAGPQLEEVSVAKGPIEIGQAVITESFKLPADYVIHTVGPVYSQHSPEQAAQLLGRAYKNSLQLADEHQLDSVAFPAISTGVFGYPKQQAAQVAVETIKNYLNNHPETSLGEIRLIAFGEANHQALKAALGNSQQT